MRTFIVCTILVFSFLCLTPEVRACLCKPTKLDFKIKNTDLIFVGEVTNITQVKDGEEITFNISNILKTYYLDIENPTNEITIFQGTRFDCVFGFEISKKYIVFTNHFPDKSNNSSNVRFSTLLCSGNEIFSNQFFRKVNKESSKLRKSKVS